MNAWSVILISISLISICGALDFSESILLNGNGSMYARTNSIDGSDGVSGIGDQSYVRALSIQEDSSSLESEYKCQNTSQRSANGYENYSNHYYLSGVSLYGTKHVISVLSDQTIESKGSVIRDGSSFLTNAVIKSQGGNLSETLSILDGGVYPLYVAETKLDGNFSISSSAIEDVEIWSGYSVEGLMLKMKDVEMQGERPVPKAPSIKKPDLILEGGFQASPQDEAAVLTREGNTLLLSGNNEQALAYYDEALKLDRNSISSSVTWTNKGVALNKLKRYQEADGALVEALRRDPNSKAAMVTHAGNLVELNRIQEAIEILNRATDKYPNYDEAWYHKGYALMAANDYPGALDAFNKNIALDEGNAESWFYKGQLLYLLATKKYNNSIEMLKASEKNLAKAKELDEKLNAAVDEIILNQIRPKLPGDSQAGKTDSVQADVESKETASNETLDNGTPGNGTLGNQTMDEKPPGIWTF